MSLPHHQPRPAELPKDLAAAGLRAMTSPALRGYPGTDRAQTLLARTLLRRKVAGELLDLSAMGGLLSGLPGVQWRGVEASAGALRALAALGLSAQAAAPGDPLPRARAVAVVLAADRGSAYAQAQLAWAQACCGAGGDLWIAGDKDKGFDRYFKAAAREFGPGEVLGREAGMRVGRLTRRPAPPAPQPPASRYHYEPEALTVVGLPGVFSAAKPDKGSALLLSALPDDLTGRRALDLGCGGGLLGAACARRGARVTCTDDDLSSVRSAEMTFAESGLSGEFVHADAAAGIPGPYDLVVTNPPFHVGRGVMLEVTAAFLSRARTLLAPGGELWLVANDFLPYEAAIAALGPGEEVARQGGFKVMRVRRV